MREVADDVWELTFRLLHFTIHAYLAGDVLFDAGARQMARPMLHQMQGHSVRSVAMTHVHPDHQGGAHVICETLNIPLACPAGEVDRMEGREPMPSWSLPMRLSDWLMTGPAHPVARALREGETVGDFTVYDTPGHSQGHVVYFRERDRLAIVGDVVNGMNLRTGLPGPSRPPDFVNEEPQKVNDSIRKLAELEPRTVCFGHGPVLRDPARLQRLAARLA